MPQIHLAQIMDNYNNLTDDEIALLNREAGKLYFSIKNQTIVDFILQDDLKYVTFLEKPNSVYIYDKSNVLYDIVKYKSTEKKKKNVSGLSHHNNSAFLTPRPNNKSNFILKDDDGKIKVDQLNNPKSKAYFSKTIEYKGLSIRVEDYYASSRNKNSIISSVLAERSSDQLDTLDIIYNESSPFSPYRSSTFDLVASDELLFVANITNGVIKVYDNNLDVIQTTDLKEVSAEEKLVSSYFMGNRSYHYQLFQDTANGSIYAYFGTKDSANKAYANLYIWNNLYNQWESVEIKSKEFTRYPFVDIKDIFNGSIYFALKIDGVKDAIYKHPINLSKEN